MCKHRFGVQLLQNPPLCSSTDSATLTIRCRRTHRSGEGKLIALYGPGIFPAWRNVKCQYWRAKNVPASTGGFLHSQNWNFPEEGFILSSSCNNALYQDLKRYSATLTGWRRSQQSGEGKMIPLSGPGIYCTPPNTELFPRLRNFAEIYCVKKS